jgi:DNA-binding transcriptional ArsR family regulator
MASNPAPPDYELVDTLALTTPAQVRAIGDPLRTAILSLLHERAATVTELATAVERPKSTVAHHVKVLGEAGLVRVVRTRRVRAIEERFYGRVARMFYVDLGDRPSEDAREGDYNDFEIAAKESAAAFEAHQLWAFNRHARVAPEHIREFWRRAMELVHEFDQLPRSGDTVYGFAVGVYPTDYPTLPPSDEER